MLRSVTSKVAPDLQVRRIAALLAFSAIALAQAPIFPDQIGEFLKSAPKASAKGDQPLYAEFGLNATEQADYKAPGKQFSATGWRFKDSTGALAMFESLRPAAAPRAKLTELSSRTSDGLILAHGNYVFQFTGTPPGEGELNQIYQNLPRWENSPLPSLVGFLPTDGLIPNSERYVLGPVSLERFEPRIPPSTAAFHLGAEAQAGKYKSAKGDITLVLFSYPTPSMARERLEEFRKIPGAIAKRTQSLLGVIIQPPDADAAERILSKVRYEGNLTLNEQVPQNFNKGLSNMILSIMALAGILAAASIIVGVGFGGFKVLSIKLGFRKDSGTMTVLGIRDTVPPKEPGV